MARHRKYRRSRRHARRNPALANPALANPAVDQALRNLWGTFLIGGGAFAVDLGLDRLFASQRNLAMLRAPVRGAVKIGTGVVLGTALASMARGRQGKLVEDAAAAISLGGMISGLTDLWDYYQSTRGAVTPTTGGAGLYALPGAPAGYVGVDRQACAVGSYRG